MNSNEIDNSFLTIDELISLDTLLKQHGISEDAEGLRPIVRSAEPLPEGGLLVAELQGRVTLSDATRRAEERRLAAIKRKRLALRKRKKYTRRRGTVHPNKKKATRRRLLRRQWEKNPFMCILMRDRRACKDFDEQKFNGIVKPLWEMYGSDNLSVGFYPKTGTKKEPWSVYNMYIEHKTLGRVYDGNGQLLYDLST